MVGIGTVGTGPITRAFVEAARASGVVDVVACCSRDPGRAAAFAREAGVPAAYGGLEELLRAPGVEAVYVASPNAAHAGQVTRCLEAGRHVLCEKPLAPTGAEVAALLDLAGRRGLVLLEGVRSVHDPGMAAVRELLPSLGVVRRVSFRYSQRSARYDRVLAGEPVGIFDPVTGGALLDLGVYCLHPLVDLFGEPGRVSAALVRVASGADGAGAALAEYPTFVADLGWSKITASAVPSEVQGEDATLTIDHIARPRELVVDRVAGGRRTLRPGGADNNLVYEIRAFADQVATGPRVADARRSLAVALLLDRVRQAATGGG